MNRITASITALGTAGAIALGGLFFAPNPAPADSAPGTTVPIELNEITNRPVHDGEVTTTVRKVVYVNGQAHADQAITSNTTRKFDVNLPDGEYLIRTDITANSDLRNVDDIDSTSPVPAGSRCGDNTDCIWIVVSGNTWSLKVGGAQTHSTAEFRLDRPAPAPTTTVPQTPPPTTQPPTTVPDNPPAEATNQTVIVSVWDDTDGGANAQPEPGVTTFVIYQLPDSQVPYTSAAVTDAQGRATHVIPVGTYTTSIVPPANHRVTHTPASGPHQPDTSSPIIWTYAVAERQAPPTTIVIEPEEPTGGITTGSQTPVETVPEPEPTPEPQPQPEPTPEPTPEPQPEPTPEPNMGCDHSDDPEIQALLWMNDGAIRWLVDGELMTLWPEPGMAPVRVCLDAYHRLTELGLDIDYYTTY